jgi:hypothetical protein
MKVSKSAEEPANIALPRSERRACSWGSARIALISLLSLSTIAPGVGPIAKILVGQLPSLEGIDETVARAADFACHR